VSQVDQQDVDKKIIQREGACLRARNATNHVLPQSNAPRLRPGVPGYQCSE
jgi:hypothetical protein